MFKVFTSVKLTLFLLLFLAVFSIFGTGAPEQVGHYELYFQTPWYRILLGLLALNLICCTWKTIRRNCADKSRFADRLQQAPSGTVIAVTELAQCQQRLQGAGFSVATDEQQLLAQRGRLGRWGSTLVHLSLLLIMLGGVIGQSGFVGTINTYLGTVNNKFYDWDLQADQELGIGLRADSIRVSYYPITLRFDLLDAESGATVRQVSLDVGESFPIDEFGLNAIVEDFDPDVGVLRVEVFRQQQRLGVYTVTSDGGSYSGSGRLGFQINNIQFRDPVLKQMETDVSVFLESKLLEKAQIRVNDPLIIGTVSIYLTAYQYHGNGVWSVGFQLSRDPGEPLVWIGSILLIVGLLIVLLLPYRVVGVVRRDDQFELICLAGFSGEAGLQQRQQVLARLND